MKFKTLNRIIWKLRHPCARCEHSLSISNHALCFECKGNDRWGPRKESYEIQERR